MKMASKTIFVPRLDLTVTVSSVREAIIDSIKEIGFELPTKEQEEVVFNFIGGQDVFVSMPTGSGKSICFACISSVFDKLRSESMNKSITVVVSPLNALMQDQVANFTSRGLQAAFVGEREKLATHDRLVNGCVQLLYFSPEALLSVPFWRELFKTPYYRDNVVCLAVDEAHLIEKWGGQFRTDFAHIGEIRSLLPKKTNIMALTATANVQTRKLILNSLEMKSCHILARNPNKLNIRYSVSVKPTDPLVIFHPYIRDILISGENAERCLCFCRTYDDTSMIYEMVALELARNNVLYPASTHPEVKLYGSKLIRTCEKFDACTSKSLKKRIVQSFTKPDGAVKIVISAVAFAMGIDVPNIHTVIHWGPPNDIESYVQETGRGGRDGQPTNAYLYYNSRDLVKSGHVTESMHSYCTVNMQCRRQVLMSMFDEAGGVNTPGLMHMCCDVCMNLCRCEQCSIAVSLSENDVKEFEELMDFELAGQSILTSKKRKALKDQLMRVRADLISEPTSILVGADILSGLTKGAINAIVKNCLDIKTVEDVQAFGITSFDFATKLFDIISKHLDALST